MKATEVRLRREEAEESDGIAKGLAADRADMFTGSEESSQIALANDSSLNENTVEVTRKVPDTFLDTSDLTRSLRSEQRELMTEDGMHCSTSSARHGKQFSGP